MLHLHGLEGMCVQASLNRAQHWGLCAGWQKVENVVAPTANKSMRLVLRNAGACGKPSCPYPTSEKSKWMLNQHARQVNSISSEFPGCRNKIKVVSDWTCTCLTS